MSLPLDLIESNTKRALSELNEEDEAIRFAYGTILDLVVELRAMQETLSEHQIALVKSIKDLEHKESFQPTRLGR